MQPVQPKGNQSWVFNWRTDAEAETILRPPDVKNWLIWKDPDARKDWGQEEKGATENERVARHHQFNGHEFEQTLGGGGGQGSLVCCGPRGHSRMRLSDWNSNCKMGKWYFLAQNGSARRQTRRKSHAFSERQIGFVPKCGHCPVSDSMCCSPGMETLDSESKTTGPVVLSLWWVQSRASSSKSTSPSP